MLCSKLFLGVFKLKLQKAMGSYRKHWLSLNTYSHTIHCSFIVGTFYHSSTETMLMGLKINNLTTR
jgi:hypothetical protein